MAGRKDELLYGTADRTGMRVAGPFPPAFDVRRDLDNWAAAKQLRISFTTEDVDRLLADGRASAVLRHIHADSGGVLGNTLNFIQMTLGRELTSTESLGGWVRLEDTGLSPGALHHLIVYVDGLLRIGDCKLDRVSELSFDEYESCDVPPGHPCWFLNAPPYQGHPRDEDMLGRRRDWNIDDYQAMPKERYLAFRRSPRRNVDHGLAGQHLFSELVFEREITPDDLVGGLMFVPREMKLSSLGFQELCNFIAQRERLAELRLRDNWMEFFPEMIAPIGA